jgi:hypothetical protein
MVFCFNCGNEIIKKESNYCQNCGTFIYEFTKSNSSSEKDKVYSYPIKRLEEQIKWHSQKARNNKKKFRLYQIITIIASALIPIINITGIGFADILTRVTSSIIGGLIAVITAITQLEKYQENWILYRNTNELLKKEKYFFENGADDYKGLKQDDKNRLLVERVESIVSSETSKYFAIHHNPHSSSQQQEQQLKDQRKE